MNSQTRRRVHNKVSLLLVALTLSASSMQAADGSWANDASGSWAVAGNWWNNFVPGGSATDAVAFTNDITAERTVTLDGNRTVNTLVFGDANTNSAAGWTISSGTGGAITLAGSNPTVQVDSLNASNSVTLNAIIDGSSGLIKAGIGALTLMATNTYMGDTIISEGVLQLDLNDLVVPTTGLALWLDATRGVTTSGSGNVAEWADQSGNGHNAINSGSTGPTVTADINGLPTLRFKRSASQFLSAGGLDGVSKLTIFIVHKDASLNQFQTFIGTDGNWRNDATYGRSVHYIASDLSGYPINYGVWGENGIGSLPATVGVAQIDEVLDNGGPYQLFCNGAANGSGSRDTTVKNLNAFRIGAWNNGRYLDSSIGEILIYTSALSEAERQMVGVYLVRKWGIASTSYQALRSVLPVTTAVSVMDNAKLVLNGASQRIAALTGESAARVALNAGLIVDGDQTTTYAGIISGASGLAIQGSGTLTLAGINSYIGPTAVNNGRLVLQNTTLASGHVAVSEDAVLEYFVPMGKRSDQLKTDLSGQGTLRKSGAGELTFGNYGGNTVNWCFSPGAQIDVQEGTFVGGSNINDLWTDNHASLSVSNNATFRGCEANVRVAGLTGAGTLKTGYKNYASGYQSFVVGVDNASSTFDGRITNDEGTGALSKTGSGTLTLTGNSTYTGHTTVDGGALKVTGHLYTAGNDAATRVLVRNGGVLELNSFGYGSSSSLGVLATEASRLEVSNGTIRMNGSSGGSRGVTVQAGGATLDVAQNAMWSLCDQGTPWVFNDGPTLTLAGAGNGVFEMGVPSTAALVKSGTGKWTLAGTNAYSGSVTVQAGTLQVMADIPANTPAPGAALWLDATRGVTTSGSGNVTAWADQSGNNRDAANNLSSGPTITADINGLPTLRFTRSASQFLSAGGLGGVSTMTIFIVHKDTTLNQYQTYIGTDGVWRNDATYGRSLHYIAADSGGFRVNYAVYDMNGYSSMPFVAGAAQLDEVVDHGGPYDLYLNGAANGSGSRAATMKNLNAFRIGAWNNDRYLDSSIGEILIYTSALTETDRQMTEAYLNAKWFNPARYGILQSASSNLLATSSSVIVGTGAVLDLGGKSQEIASLSGGGTITNGTLSVTGDLYPAGISTVGSLTLQGSTVLSGTLHVDIGVEGVSDSLTVMEALNLTGAILMIDNPQMLNKERNYTLIDGAGLLSGSFVSVLGLPPGWMVRYDRVACRISLAYLSGTIIIVR